jgi:hypothetical protein
MARGPAFLTLALAASCVLACDTGGAPRALQKKSSLLGSPALATAVLITTVPGARESELRFQPLGAQTVSPSVAKVPHVPDGEIRGALLPGTKTVVAVVDTEPAREPSFAAWLYRIEPGLAPVALVLGCYHASRPLVSATGRVFVQRGVAGPLPDEASVKAGALRSDALSVDEIDPATGAARTIHSYDGYITHLAGLYGAELLIYRVAFQHADLVAVDVDSGNVRTLAAEIPPFARDFSLDASTGSLVFTNHDTTGWLVERLDLATGSVNAVARADGMWALPHVWPGGGVLLNDGRGGSVVGGRGPDRPLGAGFDQLALLSPDASVALLLHTATGHFALPYAVDVATGAVEIVPVPARVRVDVVGVVP